MKFISTLIVIVSILISGLAIAGAVQPYIPVLVDYDAQWAAGGMHPARSSNNDVEHIGCNVNVNADGSNSGLCNAKDPEGNEIYCRFRNNAALANAVLGISDYSYVGFSWIEGDYDDECISILVSNRSFYLPKK